MPVSIKRSISVIFQSPAQYVLGGGLVRGTQFSPHFAPDSWTAGNGLIAAGATQTMVSNPGGNVGIRLAKAFFTLTPNATSASVPQFVNAQFSAGPTTFFSMAYNTASIVPTYYALDFMPFGLIPLDLTSSLQIQNQGTVSVFASWLFVWGREPLASQNE